MQDQFTRDDVLKIVSQAMTLDQARVAFQAAERPFSVQKIQLDLGSERTRANAYRVGFPFKSLYAQDGDATAFCYCILGSNDQLQSEFKLRYNAAIDNGFPVNEAYLFWDAQPGKTMTLIAFVDASFRSGSQISVSAGGVSINDGSTITGPTRVTLAATTATIIAPANLLRKKCTIQNKTGADLYIGGSTIGAVGGATEGIRIQPDAIIYWNNTGALYGWSVAGGNIHYVEET